MPILDLVCATCGLVLRDQFLPLYQLPEPQRRNGYIVKQDFDKPLCPRCRETAGRTLVLPMDVIPPRVTVDALEPMQEFAVTVEDGNGGWKVETIDSLTKLRKVEAESEARARNGEGRPMVWRDYSNDTSNRDVHTLGKTDQPRVTPEMAKKYAPRPVAAAEAESLTYGAGVTDATTSALGE